jgi:hypothetical protein
MMVAVKKEEKCQIAKAVLKYSARYVDQGSYNICVANSVHLTEVRWRQVQFKSVSFYKHWYKD